MSEEVFISYGSADRGRIQELVTRLRGAGITVWIDEAGIEGAAMWSEEIVSAINNSKVLILAVSANSTRSKNVVRELALASEDDKTILPVFLEPTEIPESMKYQLAGIQRVEYFEGNEEEAIGSVLRALTRLGISTEDKSGAQEFGQTRTAAPQPKAKLPGLVIAGIAVLVLLAVIFIFKPSGSQPTGKLSESPKNATTSQPEAKPLDKNRIVVLPFKNIGTDGENDHIVEGIVDDLNTMLSNVDGLKVIGSVSAKTYKDTDKTPIEIGQELNTGTLIQGSIQKAGAQLKINVKLIDATSGEIIWAKPFNGNETERFALQSKIINSVGENLEGVRVDESKINALQQSGTSNPDAYDLVQRAKVLMDKNSKVATKKAIELYEQAVRLDPNYADAFSGLGFAHFLSSARSIEFPKIAFPKAKIAYEKTLELDPDNPIALAGLGEISIFFDRNLREAERLMNMAIKKSPNNPGIIWSYHFYLESLGRIDEMADLTLKGIDNDPKSALLHQVYAHSQYLLGNLKDADKHNKIALSLSHTFQWALHYRSIILVDLGKFQEAEELLIQGIKDDPGNPVSIMSLGVVYWKWGKKHQAQSLLSDLLHRSHFEYIKADIISRFYVAIGDNEKAIQWYVEMKNRKELSFMLQHNHPWLKDKFQLDAYKQIYKDAGLYDVLFEHRKDK